MLTRIRRLFLICACIAASCTASRLIHAPAAHSATAPATIDISTLTAFLNGLPPDEKEEQLRDWALYGLKVNLGISPDEEAPLRRPSATAVRAPEVSPGRQFSISTREWGILVPKEHINNKPLIGSLVDRKVATLNALPESISLYSYRYDPASAGIRTDFERSISTAKIYSAEYGYHAATLNKLPDIIDFMQRIDDVVMVQWRSGSLEAGGRKYRQDSRRKLTVEEIATLYQAYNAPDIGYDRKKYDSYIQKKYVSMLRKDKRLRAAVKSGSTSEAQLLEKLRRQFPPVPADVNIGFSLDPYRNYKTLAEDLLVLSRQLAAAGRVHDKEQSGDTTLLSTEIASVVKPITSRNDVLPLLSLIQRYTRSSHKINQDVSNMLKDIDKRNSYQVARYIGNLQGTQTGMVLFYTDLLAKLWALDYNGIAPKGSIKGFRNMQDSTIPKMFWDDFMRYSYTRLWFGLRQDGFDVYDRKILFQPMATRVYSASSNPLTPGKETQANYQSREFLGWWDRHYDAVAEFEPYYHKLNQIQKWSCIFMVLKESRVHNLDYLLTVPVDRTIDFEAWLKVNHLLEASFKVPFLDRNANGCSTECLPLLSSKLYPLMGRNFIMSGGVSLASRKDIQAKLNRFGQESFNLADAPRQQVSPQKKPNDSQGQAAGPRKPEPSKSRTPAQPAPEHATVAKQPGTSHSSRRHTTGEHGTFSAEKQSGVIRLKWEKAPAVVAEEFVAGLAAIQQSSTNPIKGESIIRMMPDIRSAVRLKEGQTYLVKTASNGNVWLQLQINPSDFARYRAKASAAHPDADIFCAKVISESDAKKLATGKPSVLK